MDINDVGPLQPTLRWWTQHDSALLSAPVVTTQTPTGLPWVLQGTQTAASSRMTPRPARRSSY